ncbi:MAG: orotidine-5'-phosphate decarboxylase [Phycisphaerales bacterium]|nr:orotidine-5'-phosphate decarboxylase [Phycisphaerales bacterium]
MSTHPSSSSPMPRALGLNTDHFSDRLYGAIGATGTPGCVGLDPVYERLPGAVVNAKPEFGPTWAMLLFSRGVMEAVAGLIPAIKFQSACFERYGAMGLATLHQLVSVAKSMGFVVILDAKRGDIGVTAEHYAAASFDPTTEPEAGKGRVGGADALTVSGYLGMDTVEPFLKPRGDGLARGVFVLVRTSNPGSDEVQSLRLEDGRTVAQMMADHVAEIGHASRGLCGLSDVGAVVGATKSGEGAALRARMPDQYFLVPGYGAQGGTIEDIRPMMRRAGRGGSEGPMSPAAEAGVLVTASRSVIYAFEQDEAHWQAAVRSAAERFAGELRGLLE